MAICRKSKFATAILMAFGLSASVYAQRCPKIELILPERSLVAGETFEVNAKSDFEITNLRYEWATSAGTIVNGQNSRKIEIATSSKDIGSDITIHLIVSGLPAECSGTFTKTTGIYNCRLPTIADEFGALSIADTRARLDNVFIQLKENAGLRALFRMNFTKGEKFNARKMRISRILDAINYRKYDLARTNFVIFDGDRLSTEIYIYPVESKASLQESGAEWISGTDMPTRLSTLFRNQHQ